MGRRKRVRGQRRGATAAKIAGIADEPVTLADRGKQILQELCRVLRCDAMSIAVRDADRRIRIALAPDGEMHGAARVWTSPQGDAEQRAGSEHGPIS